MYIEGFDTSSYLHTIWTSFTTQFYPPLTVGNVASPGEITILDFNARKVYFTGTPASTYSIDVLEVKSLASTTRSNYRFQINPFFDATFSGNPLL